MKKVVLIGDSIRLNGYGTVLKDYLPKDVELYQSEDNGKFSYYTFRRVYDDRENIMGADVIHWNNGLWDTAFIYDYDEPFTPLKLYLKIMSMIADNLLKYGKKVIFSTTTPVKDNPKHDVNAAINKYNKAVIKMLRKKGVIINDLHAVIAKNIEGYIKEDRIHLTELGIKAAAESVSKVIIDNL